MEPRHLPRSAPARTSLSARVGEASRTASASAWARVDHLLALENLDPQHASRSSSPLFVPVAGPFIAIGTADASGTGAGILALDGVVQLAATTMILWGLLDPVEELERRDSIWRLMPTASQEGAGLSLAGSF